MTTEDVRMITAIRMISDFLLDEYEIDNPDRRGVFDDLTHIPVAYTKTEDGQHGIQCYIDLWNCRCMKYLDDRMIEAEEYEDLYHFIEDFLENMTFDELVRLD